MVRTYIVKIGEDYYSLSEDGYIKRLKEKHESFNVLIIPKISIELFKDAINKGYKLYECNKEEKDCLLEVFNALFPYCTTCKFS